MPARSKPAYAAEGDPAAGKRKTVTCNACHGQSGFKSMPKLGDAQIAERPPGMRRRKVCP